ncbi:MAG: hypothetical protein WCE62_19150 [Polyangiales bacterium]
MRPYVLQLADDFWNIRASFKIGRVVEIGTQASLVRRASGGFVFLDSCALSGTVERQVLELTRDGKDVKAILNVHPFHTVYARAMHERFPHARLFGTARHVLRFPELPWQDTRTEDTALHGMFAEDFEFSVPRGVDFISDDENIHFSSVMVLHRASKTIHVDDTLMYVRFPALLHPFGVTDTLRFHPTLARALQRRAGAARDFRLWAEAVADRWGVAENLCAAHTAALTAKDNPGRSIHARLVSALAHVRKTLSAHERKYG